MESGTGKENGKPLFEVVSSTVAVTRGTALDKGDGFSSVVKVSSNGRCSVEGFEHFNALRSLEGAMHKALRELYPGLKKVTIDDSIVLKNTEDVDRAIALLSDRFYQMIVEKQS